MTLEIKKRLQFVKLEYAYTQRDSRTIHIVRTMLYHLLGLTQARLNKFETMNLAVVISKTCICMVTGN